MVQANRTDPAGWYSSTLLFSVMILHESVPIFTSIVHVPIFTSIVHAFVCSRIDYCNSVLIA